LTRVIQTDTTFFDTTFIRLGYISDSTTIAIEGTCTKTTSGYGRNKNTLLRTGND